MATKLIVLFTTGVFVASLAYSLRPQREPVPAQEPRSTGARDRDGGPRLLGPRVRELRAGRGIWSAWSPYPPLAGEATTVLWRTEGTVARPVVSGARGAERAEVRFGPAAVLPTLAGAGFEWARPGREWGARLVFPSAGVWTVRVRAGARAGALRVRVVEPRPASG